MAASAHKPILQTIRSSGLGGPSVVRGVGALIQVVVASVGAQTYGADGFSDYFVYFGWIKIVSAVGLLGLNYELLRCVAATPGSAGPLFRSAVRSGAARVVVATGLALTITAIATELTAQLAVIYAVGAIGSALVDLGAAMLKGLGRATLGLFIEFVLAPLAVLGALIGAQVVDTDIDIISGVHAGTVIGTGLLTLGWAFRTSSGDPPTVVVRAGLQLALMTTANVLLWSLPIVGSSWLDEPEVATFLAVNIRILSATTLLLHVLGAVYSKRFAAAAAVRDVQLLESERRRAQLLAAAGTTLVLVPILILRSSVLEVFGVGAGDAGDLLLIMAGGQILNGLSGLSAEFALMTNRPDIEALSAVVSLVVATLIVALSLVLDVWTGTSLALGYAGAVALRATISYVRCFLGIRSQGAGYLGR